MARIAFLAILLTCSFSGLCQQHVLLLINEAEKEVVVLNKKDIKDMLTLDFKYSGEAQLITEDGVYGDYHKYPLDSIHSLVVKHGNFKAKLGFPFKALGVGFGALGGLLIWSASSIDDPNATDDESSDALSRLVLGIGTVGLGTGFFILGKKIGDRPVEKEKTTYYLDQWDVRIVEKSRVDIYRRAVKN